MTQTHVDRVGQHGVFQLGQLSTVAQEAGGRSEFVFLAGRLAVCGDLVLDLGVHDLHLLSEAGYPDGLTLDLVATKLRHVRKNYETLQTQLARVGIKINLIIVDHFQMHRLVRQDLSPIVIYEAWRPNTDVFLSRFFHSDSIVVSGKNPDTNFSHYQDIDSMILLAREEMNPLKQEKLWEYAQIKLLEDMVVYPLHYRNRSYIRRGYVDYGHALKASMALYPQVTEKTRLLK